MNYAPFPLVEISGHPYERGVAYGRAATERIKRSVRLYAEQMSGMDFSWDEVRGIVSDFVPAMERFAPDLVEEMRGIAAGAAREREVAPQSADDPLHCSDVSRGPGTRRAPAIARSTASAPRAWRRAAPPAGA